MNYLLDTDTCIYAIKGHGSVAQRLLAQRRSAVAVSVITEGELRFGAAKSSDPMKSLSRVLNFLAPIQVLPLMSKDIAEYATIRAMLEKAGKRIGDLDMLIAGHALSRGFTLVTNNVREFARVTGLVIENWV